MVDCAFRSITSTSKSASKSEGSPPHNVNGEDAALMAREQIIDEVADDGVWFVAEFGYDAADEGAAAGMPFQIDRAVNIVGAVNLGPAVRAGRLFRPDFDKAKFFIQ